MAETTTALRSEGSLSMIFATFCILSQDPTQVPPNLCTDHVSPLGTTTTGCTSLLSVFKSSSSWTTMESTSEKANKFGNNYRSRYEREEEEEEIVLWLLDDIS